MNSSSMLRSKVGAHRPQADINVTPLVDVMLVLLIIFMVTAPMMSAGLAVKLPNASASQPLEPKAPIVVTLERDGRVHLGSDEIAADAVGEGVLARVEGDLQRSVHIRADRDTPHGAVVEVLNRIAGRGLTHIAILTQHAAQPAALSSQTDLPAPRQP
ncbi:MAG: biopolymer transporter ExbD [Alphaproteobacteria bacterium]|nr:biopolymer transporter ExbD [Alphaproteobacteria bacterium]